MILFSFFFSAIQEQAPSPTIENTLNLTNVLAELLRVATEAEKSLGEAARKSGVCFFLLSSFCLIFN